jgi:hypothetical protein
MMGILLNIVVILLQVLTLFEIYRNREILKILENVTIEKVENYCKNVDPYKDYRDPVTGLLRATKQNKL